jgi:hypothetical protein
MGKKSYQVALTNRYPQGQIMASAEELRAYDAEGALRVCVAKTGQGVWEDIGADEGASDKFSLEPIPKDARFTKLYPDGRIGPAEEFQDRKAIALQLAQANNGVVPSIAECKAKGWMDDQGKWTAQAPQAKAAAAPGTQAASPPTS